MRYAIVFISLAVAVTAQSQVPGVAQASGSSAYVCLELRMIPLETVVVSCLKLASPERNASSYLPYCIALIVAC